MTAPLILVLAGLATLAGTLIVLRSFGPGYRVGRLLAVTPRVSIAEAVAIASTGRPRYVRIEGRIDSDEEFEDEAHRPLVLRRTTLAARTRAGSRGPWIPFETNLEVVPFVVREGPDEVAVDGRQLDDGLVVIPRESVGRVADLGDRAPTALDPDARARLRIEQVSSVEHAAVLGVPVSDGDHAARMAPGLGRPLVLTTLESGEAMRVLVGGEVARPRLAILLLIASVVLVGLGAAWWLVEAVMTPTAVLAASPDPTVGPGSDTRSPGQGPGLVGDPLFAVVVVVVIALAAVAGTTAWIRLTDRRPASRER